MKNKLFRVRCVLFVIPIVFVSSVSAASSARSDTTGNFTVTQGKTYTFKITSSSRPTLAAGSKFFRYVSSTKSGDHYFIKFSAIGKAGDGCGFYLDGGKHPVAIARITAEIPHSDTTGNFTVPQGKTYTFKITFSSKPSLAAGSKSFQYVSTKQSGSNYFIKFSAVGKAGDGCGFYLDGGKKPVAIATVGAASTEFKNNQGYEISTDGTWEAYDSNRDNYKLHIRKKNGSGDRVIVNDSVLCPCLVGDWVYYFNTLDEIDKVKLDGSGKTKVCGTEAIDNLNGSTAITASYQDGYILYRTQQMREVGDSNTYPPYYYRLDVSKGTLTPAKG